MKLKVAIILSLLCCASVVNSQERLQKLLERYDYGTAIHVIDSLMATDNADSIDLALQKARCLRKLYRADEAAGVLTEVLHLDQFNTELMAELAECHIQAGNTEDAFNLYSLLSGIQPDNVYFKICQARILYREKQYKESIAACKSIISQDSIPDILSLTADAYKNIGAADSALVYYDHVLRMKPYHVQTLSKKADILLSAKQHLPVIDMSREYLKNDPDNMTMLPIYGLALHLQGSYTLSIEQFEHLLDIGGDSYAVHYYLGLNHYMMDNWARAIPEFEKAYQIDSSDVTLVYQLANAMSHRVVTKGLESSNLDLNPESERLYAKALDMLKPNPAMMHNIYGSMAMARNRLEMFKEAIEYYELSYRYNPKNISALSSIGYCYERMKDYMKALEYYERYLKVGKPGSRGYEFVEESIEYCKQELFMENEL